MARKKVHKKEVPNKPEPTPQVKKAKDLRASGFSLREIAEKLKIPRKAVEAALAAPKLPELPVAPVAIKAVSKGKSRKGK